RHHDAPVVLLAHDGPYGLGAIDRAHHVHIHHQPEIVQAHLGEALVAQDAGVVDEDVDAPPLVHGLPDHGFHRAEVRHAAAVDDRLAAGPPDFLGDGTGARSFALGAEVVDYHSRTVPRQRDRV